MGANTYEIEVWFEGKEDPVCVVGDQRDVAMFEREEKIGMIQAMDLMPTIFARSIAWFALRRTGHTEPGTKRKDWEDRVIDVQFGDEDEPDPTNQEASGETA